jgi:hypothetical protein
MKIEKAKNAQLRTWYGLKTEITVGPGFIHWIGWHGFHIPHPPIVNWLLRRGLNEDDYYTLSISHEFAHFQSAPLALPYTVGLIALGAGRGLSFLSMVIIIISTHAVWELFSEIFTILCNRQYYRRCYMGIPSRPRRIFWISMSVLSILGWGIVMYRG